MRSPRKAAIIFAAILLVYLLSFVSAELNKRDPQGPQGPGGPPPPTDNAPAPSSTAAPAAAPQPGPTATPTAAPASPGGNTTTTPLPGGDKPQGGIQPGGNITTAAPGGNSTSGNSTATTTSYPPVDPTTPPVQVLMQSPKPGKNILYAIGDNITFQWTYSTNFAPQNQPKSIQAYAQPEINQNTNTYFTIVTNATVNQTQTVTWVTRNVSSLPMAKYKLWVCDERGVNATANPGGLQVFAGGLEFGLYDPNQDGGDISCPNCNLNNAISISTIPLLSTICFALITIISFNFIS